MDSTIPGVSTLSPTPGVPATFVVVWEWENHQKRWRPYSPDVTQLLERAHHKNLNRIYLKDADPILEDFHVDMNKFIQVCEPSGETFLVRREFYPHSSPAGKGAKWEWGRDSSSSEWHIYDMEVQIIIEEAWTVGSQTVDISLYFPGCPYIMNFCNMTQVRKNSGVVRPIRRTAQASYPIVKLGLDEITAVINRRKERYKMSCMIDAQCEMNKPSKKQSGKKSVKHLFSHFLHQRSFQADRIAKEANDLSIRKRNAVPTTDTGDQSQNGEYNYTTLGLDEHQKYFDGSESEIQTINDGRFFDYSSFSSVSETASLTRRPSIDTISTYLSHESVIRQNYGFFTRSLSNSGSHHGSEGLLFKRNQNEEQVRPIKNATAFQSRRPISSAMDSSRCWIEDKNAMYSRVRESNRIETDPNQNPMINLDSNHTLPSPLQFFPSHLRQTLNNDLEQNTFVPSKVREITPKGQCLNAHVDNTSGSSPIHRSSVSPKRSVTNLNNCSSSSSNLLMSSSMAKRKPVPSPRKVLNSPCGLSATFLNNPDLIGEWHSSFVQLIFRHAYIVENYNDTEDFCPICNQQLDFSARSQFQGENEKKTLVCFAECKHTCHFLCIKDEVCKEWLQQMNYLDPKAIVAPTSVQCPKCKIVYGVLKSTMSSLGSSMSSKVIPKGLPGYEDYHSIQITYNMVNGVQGADHPHPGEPFLAIGFPRTAFLPDTEVGRKVLKLLEAAFKQGLTFKIQPSESPQASDVVVWNDAISHKVDFIAPGVTGFPDPDYLDSVLDQLRDLGLT